MIIAGELNARWPMDGIGNETSDDGRDDGDDDEDEDDGDDDNESAAVAAAALFVTSRVVRRGHGQAVC